MNHRFIALRLVLAAIFVAAACSGPRKDIVLLRGEAPSAEIDSLEAVLTRDGVACRQVSLTDAAAWMESRMIWYHRTDTSALTQAELDMAPQVSSWLEKGGQLILSMDAVRLTHAWGLETEAPEVMYHTAFDDGFGRKKGFHAYRSHPLFDDLFGGAYTYHGLQDEDLRVVGYFSDKLPKREGSRIIATLWELIFYHPQDKVIWEQPVGKGRILSIGAFLYYSRENLHKDILSCFTRNVVNFMSGAKMSSPVRYWTYDKAETVVADPMLKRCRKAAPAKWNLSVTGDTLCFPASGEEINVPGRRCMTVLTERSGIKEIWTHPIMSLKDYKAAARVGDTLYPLDTPDGDIEMRYNAVIRHYKAGDRRITEVVTTSVDEPVTVVHYEWDGGVDAIETTFTSNLRYMWPYDEKALGSILHGWSPEKGCYAFWDGNREFVSLVGADVAGEPLHEGNDTDRLQMTATVAWHTAGKQACDVVLAAGSEGFSKAEKAYAEAVLAPESVFSGSADFYRNWLDTHVTIDTPDSLFNEGYRWAMISAEQFLAETPGIGTGLMAGYSSSLRGWGGGHRVSGRPGYAWYFGRDSELSGLAFLGMGDFEAVRQTLDVLGDFQGINGTIFHELTTSGSDHFDASDATPLYVVLMAEYLRASGDKDYVLRHLDRVYKAMDFCATTDYNGDHLIEITHVGHGWLEGGDYFIPHTEFYLSGIWCRALSDAAMLARLGGDNARAEAWEKEAATVRTLLEDFWNPAGYYNYAKKADGTYSTALLALPSVPVWLGVTDPARARQTVAHYSRSDFSQPWGVRQTNDPRPEEHVGAYDESNIWPLFTGSVSLAEYCTGLYKEGFDHLMASLMCYRSATHGRVPEVLRGNAYRSGGITRHQCWSETAVTGPAIQGMLGWRADETAGAITLAPRLPADWDWIRVKNLAAGEARISLEMEKQPDAVVYTLDGTLPRKVDFSPALPAGSTVRQVRLNGKTLDFRTEQIADYTILHLDLPLQGRAVIEITL